MPGRSRRQAAAATSMTSSPIPTAKAPCRFAHNGMRSGIAKATRGRVLAISSRYSSVANSSSENICGRAENVATAVA
jgi:hypothetical protein